MRRRGGVVGVRNGPPALQDVVGLGPVGVVDGLDAHELLIERIVLGGRRVVAQFGVLDHHVADIDAEAGHAAVPPEPHDVLEGAPHVVAPPVEVGLLGLEVVEEVLAAGLVHLPGRAAEDADPVVGRAAVGLGVGPDVPVPVLGVGARSGVDEPGVLVAGVVGHQVHQDPDAPLGPFGHQRCRGRPGCRSRGRCRSSPRRRSPSRGWARQVTGESQMPVMPSSAR